MEVLAFLVAFLVFAAIGAVWSTRSRPSNLEDAREAGKAWADAERTRSAAYACSHLPIDNPRVSRSRGGF